ncbi:MAG: response regulator [Candidatus Omnitrophica bacterium]|nr:response regulator [Candidatus Omnitrophota bacterium]
MGAKILVVDDEAAILEMLTLRLKRNGYEVMTAVDGEQCLRRAEKESPDLIILDALMPGLSGFEVCKRLKANDKTMGIPVIMLTALGDEKDLSKGLEDGAECFITKPFNPVELIDEIKIALDKREKRKTNIT